MTPHTEIRRTGDRRWTLRLVEALRAGVDPEEAAASLIACADPRAVAPLTVLLTDPEAPAPLREAASAVLRDRDPPESELLRQWWAQGDDLLRTHALLQMGRAEADLVVPVAADPAHPLHRAAIDALTFGFDEARFQAPKIAALSHPDPDVRSTAACALLYDEPAAAEVPLLRAAGDADPEVAGAAADALAYYPTRRVVEALAELSARASPAARERLAESLAEIARAVRIEAARGGATRDAVLGWVAPVRDLLALTDADLAPDPGAGRSASRPAPTHLPDPAQARALLADPDCPRQRLVDTLRGLRSDASLGPELARHADPELRALAAAMLAAGGDVRALLGLLDDPAISVRKSATWALTGLPPDPEAGLRLWEQLGQAATAGTFAHETVGAWAVHAAPDRRACALADLVRDDPRESVRCAAVVALERVREGEAARALLPLLREPPAVSWAVHLALLRAASFLGLPRAEHGLGEVDHLYVRAALGAWAA